MSDEINKAYKATDPKDLRDKIMNHNMDSTILNHNAGCAYDRGVQYVESKRNGETYMDIRCLDCNAFWENQNYLGQSAKETGERKVEYKKLWHDRIDEFAEKANSNPCFDHLYGKGLVEQLAWHIKAYEDLPEEEKQRRFKEAATKESEYQKLWHNEINIFTRDGSIDYLIYEYIGSSIMAALIKLIDSGELNKKLKAKFDKGMSEHGMGFEKVDFDKEIEDEILDICNYFIGKHYIEKEKIK